MKTYTCATCEKEFKRYPNNRNKSGLYYCSRACAAQRQQKAGDFLNCPQCGKEFYRKPSELKLTNNYCSRKCANQSQSRTLENIPELRKSGREKACEHCKRIYTVKPYRFQTSRFCSRACSHAHRWGKSIPMPPKDISGDNNPNFKGTTNRVTARENALKYLGDKCMICGWDVVVDVHHITPIRHGGSNNINNLIVLCPNHHAMADRKLISQKKLKTITLAVVAQLSDRLPRFDPHTQHPGENGGQQTLFELPEPPSQSD